MRLTDHVKSIGHEGQRVGKEARDNLDEEKQCVNGYHHLDPGTLGPGHLLKNTHGEEMTQAPNRVLTLVVGKG